MSKGKVKVICPKCGGSGKIVMPKFPQGAGNARVLCPECKGKGWVEADFVEDVERKVFFSQ